MDLLYSGNLDAFAIVSSDSDFTRLATRLRESGKTVYGLGRRRTPASLVAACDRFIFLEVLGQADDGAGRRAATTDATSRRCPTCGGSSTAAIETDLPGRRLGRRSARSGTTSATTHASFDPRNYGFPSSARWPGPRTTSRSSRGTAARRGCG